MSSHRPFLQYLRNYSDRSRGYLDAHFVAESQRAHEADIQCEEIVDRYAILSRHGKRLRGALMQLGYELAGGTDTERILQTSLSVELLHSALLIHDDIMDHDVLRRGEMTMHEYYRQRYATHPGASDIGSSIAICGGDIGIFMAFSTLAQSGFDPLLIQKAIQLMGKYGIYTGYGQAMDALHTYDPTGSKAQMLKVHKYKTAYYTGVMPLHIGAVLASLQDPDKIAHLVAYGEALGWAFQIQDDILGTFGDAQTMGKSDTSDLTEGKRTIVLLEFLARTDEAGRQLAGRVVGNRHASPDDIALLLEQMRSVGALSSSIDTGWEYVRKAEGLVPLLTTDPGIQSILIDAVRYMMERVA